jgi:uncharacterized protein (TIGR02001 family)
LRLLRALALGSIFFAASAEAQFTANARVVSDYRFRGVSLSDEKPAVQASVNWDGAGGWYGGAFASTVQLHGDAETTGQGVLYFGVAGPADDGFNWDLGADYSAFSEGRSYDYGEVYAGITYRKFTARLHYSPNYFGFGRHSFYGEVNATHALGDGFVVLAHVGVLIPVGQVDDNPSGGTGNPVDARVGFGVEIAGFNVELAWVGITGTGHLYPVYGTERRNTVVASVSRSF